MACSDAAVILEGLPWMSLVSGSGAMEQLKGKELGREVLYVRAEVKNTSGDPFDLQKKVAALIDQFADGDKIRFSILKDGTPSYTGKLASIQAEKMDKAPVEVQTEKMDKALVDGEKEEVETGKEAETDDSVGDNGKYRLPDDYVRSILAMTRSTPPEDIVYPKIPNLAELLGIPEETIEEDRRLFFGEEAVARSKRINDNMVLCQENFREQMERQGYVEVDEEYLDDFAKRLELSKELWKDFDWSDMEFADPNDPDYAFLFEPEEGEGLCAAA